MVVIISEDMVSAHLVYNIALVFLTAATVAVYGQILFSTKNDPLISQLWPANFTATVHQSPSLWVVFFYAGWCGHCQNSAPEFSKLATDIQGRNMRTSARFLFCISFLWNYQI